MLGFLVSIVPSAGAIFLFWLALRAIFQADRRERAAVAQYEAAHGLTPSGAAPAAAPATQAPAAPASAPAASAPDAAEGAAPTTPRPL